MPRTSLVGLRLGLRRLLGPFLILGVAASSACDPGDGGLEGVGYPIRVMTQNLYLGTDLSSLALVQSPAAIPDAAAVLWANVLASDYPERAKVIADEIVAYGPDLVALQEVTLYRQQVPSDMAPGEVTPNATEMAMDFLAILMSELEARGAVYVVAGEATNADVELPVADGTGGTFDLRVTDRDVILAREGVSTSNFVVNPFQAAFTLTIGGDGGVSATFTRSSSHLDAVVGDAMFTFGNAHLEIGFLQEIQIAQAEEMLDTFAAIHGSVILAGDFNSPPMKSSYPLIMTMFHDAYPPVAHALPGFTCCQEGNLMNELSTADTRIDLVLTRGLLRSKEMMVVGSDPVTGKTPNGLWASDHFGVQGVVELVP